VEKALRTSGDFNGELENCVLAYIDDVDLSKCPHGHNRIKEWVTAKILLIRKMRTDPYNQPNTLHFIQCANNISACPIFPGDTRITAMYVGDLLPEQKIPKTILEDRLIEEAPNFLATLMNLTLPPVVSRLRLPVVTTAGKLAAEEHNEDAVETFIKAQCTEVDASDILFSEFYAKFVEWLDPADQAEWSKRKTTANLPVKHGTIKKGQNKLYIRNLAWKEQ
jgi:phage/plasmid-associated DNA primase